MLAHNGEINTLKGNLNWMKATKSAWRRRLWRHGRGHQADRRGGIVGLAALDAVFEVLVRAGRHAPMAKTMLVPEVVVQAGELNCRRRGATCIPIATR